MLIDEKIKSSIFLKKKRVIKLKQSHWGGFLLHTDRCP